MKFSKFLAVTLFLLVSVQGFGAEIGSTVSLSECGGYVTSSRTFSGELKLTVRGARDCSLVDIYSVRDSATNERLGGSDRNRSGEFYVSTMDGEQVRVVVHSVSRKHQDIVLVSIPAPTPAPERTLEMTFGERTYLPSCGGTVEVTSKGGQVNLVFRNVENCSNFDIVSNSGERFAYQAKKLQKQGKQRGGSFTIPKHMIRDIFDSFLGFNRIKVRVNSNSGAHTDTIIVKFYNWNW